MSITQAYRLNFPGGVVDYLPLEGKIIDQNKTKTYVLPDKREFSLLSEVNADERFTYRDFKPLCLTLYSSHLCNLNCTYCYVPLKENHPEEFMDSKIIESGALFVARSCKERNQPFVLGFHGGNEPLLRPDKIKEALDICESVARNEGLEFIPFCTTNGVIPEETARWAADSFHGITLSWDGPPELHNLYRKDRADANTDQQVEASARIFSDPRKGPPRFLIRCTITGESVGKMEEITRFFNQQGARLVEFYPAFQNRIQPVSEEIIPDPRKFVYNYLKARGFANTQKIKVMFSGSRIFDHHSRYCMILQDNLTITPDGYLTNCFRQTENYGTRQNQFFYGKYDPVEDKLKIDGQNLNLMLRKSTLGLPVCSACFNQFHCSMGCPDTCPFEKQDMNSSVPDCIREKWLGFAAILEMTGHLPDFSSEKECTDFFQAISYQRI